MGGKTVLFGTDEALCAELGTYWYKRREQRLKWGKYLVYPITLPQRRPGPYALCVRDGLHV